MNINIDINISINCVYPPPPIYIDTRRQPTTSVFRNTKLPGATSQKHDCVVQCFCLCMLLSTFVSATDVLPRYNTVFCWLTCGSACKPTYVSLNVFRAHGMVGVWGKSVGFPLHKTWLCFSLFFVHACYYQHSSRLWTIRPDTKRFSIGFHGARAHRVVGWVGAACTRWFRISSVLFLGYS